MAIADEKLQAINTDLLAALEVTLQTYLDQCAMTPDTIVCNQARAAIARAKEGK